MRRSFSTIALLLAFTATVAAAQGDRASRFMDNCRRNGWGDDERFCETRNFTIPVGKSLTVDGRANGGITVHGWDKAETQVVAMIQANAESTAEAQTIAKGVNVLTNGAEIRAEGPDTGRRQSWSVSYEIWAPRQTDLTLTANNGGISVDAMTSKMQLETENGGLTLTDVAGEVHGRTVNGGINADLSGNRWIGAGLDLRTSNGGVHLTIPSDYSANLETGTVNGSLNVDFPVTIQGRLSRTREFTTALGSGGATIRATTTNGGVSIRRK
jgi:DUF4097 and DUF4098 domain-containing protein YvlB